MVIAKMLKEMKSETKITHTNVGIGAAPGAVAAVQSAMEITILGTMPAMQPKM
jgi:hypothetical protein